MRNSTARIAATALMAVGLAHGTAEAATAGLPATPTVAFESASATLSVTATQSEEGNPFMHDYEFTGSVVSGSGCYSVWLSFGPLPPPAWPPGAAIGRACAGEVNPVHATRKNVQNSIGGPARSAFWVVICRGTDRVTCGQAVAIA